MIRKHQQKREERGCLCIRWAFHARVLLVQVRFKLVEDDVELSDLGTYGAVLTWETINTAPSGLFWLGGALPRRQKRLMDESWNL